MLLYVLQDDSHAKIMQKIEELFPNNYIYIDHVIYDENGNEVLEGHGKKHRHIILSFKNPRYWSAVLRDLNMKNESGLLDFSLLHPLGWDMKSMSWKKRKGFDSLEGNLLYLLHENDERKEKYDISALHGSPLLIQLTSSALAKEKKKKLSKDDFFSLFGDFMRVHADDNISLSMFREWVVCLGLTKFIDSPFVRAEIAEHNKSLITQISGNSIKRKNDDTVFNSDDWQELFPNDNEIAF